MRDIHTTTTSCTLLCICKPYAYTYEYINCARFHGYADQTVRWWWWVTIIYILYVYICLKCRRPSVSEPQFQESCAQTLTMYVCCTSPWRYFTEECATRALYNVTCYIYAYVQYNKWVCYYKILAYNTGVFSTYVLYIRHGIRIK